MSYVIITTLGEDEEYSEEITDNTCYFCKRNLKMSYYHDEDKSICRKCFDDNKCVDSLK